VGRLLGLDIVVDLASGVVCFPSSEHSCSAAADHHRTGLVNCDGCCSLFDPNSYFLLPPAQAK
jgi:hypothetical protein